MPPTLQLPTPRSVALSYPPHAHPLIKRIFGEMRIQGLSISEVADRAGIARVTLSMWRYRALPTLPNLQAVADVLGLRLALVRDRE